MEIIQLLIYINRFQDPKKFSELSFYLILVCDKNESLEENCAH